MAMIFSIIGVWKSGFGGFEQGHYFKKPRDDRGLELAKSWRGMSHKKFISWKAYGTGRSYRDDHTRHGRATSISEQFIFFVCFQQKYF